MSTGVQTVTGKFVWHDHGSPEPAKARELYGGLFGWEFETFGPGEMNYEMIRANSQLHGGFGSPPGNPPPHWMGSVLVDDADAAAERAKNAGGTILAEPMDIPEVGRVAVIADPQGAVVAAFSPQGDPPVNEGVFVWDELLATDVDDAKRFYGEVFGWTSRDVPMGESTYTIFMRAGDVDVGGLMHRPDERIPPNWTTYIGTGDVDATRRARERPRRHDDQRPDGRPGTGTVRDHHRSHRRRLRRCRGTASGYSFGESSASRASPNAVVAFPSSQGSFVIVAARPPGASRASTFSSAFSASARVAKPPTCGLAEPRPSSRYRYAHSGCPLPPFALSLNTWPCWHIANLLDRPSNRGGPDECPLGGAVGRYRLA